MKTFSLELSYPDRLVPAPQENGTHDTLSLRKTSLAAIAIAVNSRYHSDPMDLAKAKMWAKIQDKIMDEDGAPASGDIVLSEEQFDFLLDAFARGSYQPQLASTVAIFAEYLEKVKISQ